MRFSKTEIIQTLAREDRSYRLGIMCTHWIRDVERYSPSAANLAPTLNMLVDDRLVSNAALAVRLQNPNDRELLSSDFLLTYLHTLIRAPFELLSDYCEDFDQVAPGSSLLSQLKAQSWYAVSYIVRNAVSHNFRIELGKMRSKLPIRWRTVEITAQMDGQPMTAAIFWHKPGYELFLEMRAFAEALPELPLKQP